MELNQISGIIIDEIYKTYMHYGPGLFEKVYELSLEGRLKARGLKVIRQHTVWINDEFVQNEPGYKLDLLVEGRVVIELKSVEQLTKVHYKQLQTYLKLSDLNLGILVNFNCSYLKDNIKRIVNGLPE